MLFDQKWRYPKVKPQSLEGFIAWLELQPPDRKYRWADRCACVMAQYRLFVFGHHYGATLRNMLGRNSYDTYIEIGAFEPHTFGAALQRAREIQQRG